MADNLDPEVLAQFQEAMRQATEAAKAMPAAMSSMVDTINKAQSSLKNNTKATQDQTDAVEDNTDAVEENEAMLKAQAEAAKKEKEARNLQTAAILQARTSLISFGDALLSGTRGFEKYNKSINSAGDAALDFGKSLGGVGTILGYIVKGATMVGSAMMKQADDTLKATDELSKMGTAGAFSAEQVRKMGTGLGLASDQLDKLVKPVKSLGSSLISLGGNAADGADAFAKLAVVTSEQRQAYQRLGISQEEQIQNTADFINLQTQQGRQITEQMKRDGTLKTAAREYTDNLLELAALTGKDIEAVKKKNELAMGEIETAIQNNLLDQEINRLRKLDTAESRARADQLEQERKARDKLLQRVENEVGDPALRKGLAKFLATGAITEEVAALKRIGVPVEDFAAKIKQGVDVSDQFMDSLSKNGDAMVRNVGTAAMFDENTRKAFGVSSEFMNYLAKARDRDEKSMSDLTKARINEAKEGKKGPVSEDPAQKARNALTEAEISAKVALDDLVASANPLLNNFSDMSLTVKALIVAAGLATAALGALAAAATVNAAKGALNTIRNAGGVGGKILDAATSTGTGLAKATKIGGGIAAVGMGAYEGYQAYKAGDKEGMGGAAGGTTGALVGGALGSLLGPVGTVLGGMAGQYFGEKVGRWLASDGDKKDPKAGAALTRAEIEEKKFALNREKYAIEQQATDQTVSEAERKLAQIKLRTIAKEEALLLNQEAINEYKNAKTDEEREAAKGKSDRARATLAQLKTEEATYQLEKETDSEKRKTLEAQLLQARNEAAQVEIHRATQILKSNANEEEKKAAQARLDNAKKQLEQETITIKKNEEIRKAEEELKKAVNDEQKKDAEAKIKLLKEGLEKELEAINKKYNTTEAKPVEASQGGQAGPGSFTVVDAYANGGTIPDGKLGIVGEKGPELVTGPAGVLNAEQIRKFAGFFANGGSIPQGKFGVVGEAGPEFVSGPATVTSQKQIAAQFASQSEELIDSFDNTGQSVQKFDTELSSFVREDPVGKMTKQLNTVTAALEDLNELMDPMGPGGLDALGPTAQPSVPSAQSIISAVLGGIAGMFGGRGRTPDSAAAGGGGSSGASSSSGSTSAGGAGSADISAPGVSSGTSSVPTAMPSSGAGGAGGAAETQQGMEVRIGREIRKGGTVSWRTNNPGNISYGPLAQKYGAIGRWIKPDGDLQQRTTGIAIFPTIEHGDNLKMALWRRPLYIDRTIDEGVMKWTGTVPPGSSYAQDLARAANASLGTRIRDLSDQQLRAMTDKQKVWEGFKEGQVSQAALGGIFSGPSTGYPVEMHGKEMVTRLDPNSLLEKLAKTPASQIASEMNSPTKVDMIDRSQEGMKELAAINMQMMEMLSEKLDGMINRLDTSNETQDKLLKFSQA